MTWDGRGDTAWLCPPKQEAPVHWASLPKERVQVFLATSALSSTQLATPDPDKICMCHNLQNDPTPCKSYHTPPHSICLLWRTWLKSLKTDMACCSKCDNINRLPKINKAAVHSPQAWQIMLHDCSMILLRVTGTLLLSQRRLITLEVP